MIIGKILLVIQFVTYTILIFAMPLAVVIAFIKVFISGIKEALRESSHTASE